MSRSPVLLDCGTSYTKIHYLRSGKRSIVPTREVHGKLNNFDIAASTGHNRFGDSGKHYNELVALAEGGLGLVDDTDFTLLDCGARDLKYVQVQDGRVRGMDWNTECGAFAGQTIELLSGYLGIDIDSLEPSAEKIPVVCGVLGMTQLFDMVSQGEPHEKAFAMFLRGIAFNCETLVEKPPRLYLSGGLCENPAFTGSFSCEVIPLGRFALLDGLLRLVKVKSD